MSGPYRSAETPVRQKLWPGFVTSDTVERQLWVHTHSAALQGCLASGKTLHQALADADEAAECAVYAFRKEHRKRG